MAALVDDDNTSVLELSDELLDRLSTIASANQIHQLLSASGADPESFERFLDEIGEKDSEEGQDLLREMRDAQDSGVQIQQPIQVQVDDAGANASYANFCRVTGSPEELIIDFGLNTQPIGGAQGSNSSKAANNCQLLYGKTLARCVTNVRSAARISIWCARN